MDFEHALLCILLGILTKFLVNSYLLYEPLLWFMIHKDYTTNHVCNYDITNIMHTSMAITIYVTSININFQ